MKYSKLQYFLWLISGSEISVLEKCPNEYNRHANIGLMILVTSLFAAFTSFVAGYTFAPDNLIGVSLFSLSWALLIFAIDRSMVNSIKRDPNVTEQPFWQYFVPRLILAFILAFFMSIPLDHIVFHEKIERQMIENNNNDWLRQQDDLNKGFDIARRDSNVVSLSKEVDALSEKLESGCPLPNYKQAISDYNNCNPKIRPLEIAYNNKVNERKAYYRQLQLNQDTLYPKIDSRWITLNEETKNAQRTLQNQRTECEGYKQEAKRIDSTWQAGLNAEITRKDSIYQKQDALLKADQDSVVIKSTKFKSEIDKMKGFDTQFTTLFLMPNWGVQILKWLIFLALLVIEILPTYLKLKTPIGQYDRRMQEREDITALEIEKNLDAEREIREKTENHRATVETQLNNTIYDKISAIELKLAEETLAEWEKNARKQRDTNVDSANQKNDEV